MEEFSNSLRLRLADGPPGAQYFSGTSLVAQDRPDVLVLQPSFYHQRSTIRWVRRGVVDDISLRNLQSVASALPQALPLPAKDPRVHPTAAASGLAVRVRPRNVWAGGRHFANNLA